MRRLRGRTPAGAGHHSIACAVYHPREHNLPCDCGAIKPAQPVEPEPQPHEVELLGLGVVVTVFERRMMPAERRRALNYLNDRYGET